MKFLLAFMVIVLLLGPLRHWAGRHWAFLVSLIGGATAGFILGSILIKFGAPTYVPLLAAIIFAVECARFGPEMLRDIEKDGRK
jgi:peptidoglycan/LPS O-acetylase OafA/YrhL